MSKTSVEEFLSSTRNHLGKKLLEKLAVVGGFTLFSDETTYKADWAELSIFTCFVDPDSNKVTEKFFCASKVEREFLCSWNIDIQQVRFEGMVGTNTMSREKLATKDDFHTK